MCPASKIMRMSGVQSGNTPLVYVSTGSGFASNHQTLTSGPLLKSLTVLFRSFDTVASRAGIVNADTYFVFNVIKQIVQCGKKTAKPILSHLPSDLVRMCYWHFEILELAFPVKYWPSYSLLKLKNQR